MKHRLLLPLIVASLAAVTHGPTFAMTADASSAASWLSASVSYDKLPAVEAAKAQNRTYYSRERLLASVSTSIERSLEALIARELAGADAGKAPLTQQGVSTN